MRLLNTTESIVLSICLHLLLLGATLIYNMDFAAPPARETVTVDFVSPTPGPKVKAQKNRPADLLQKQIVEQAEKPINNETPDDTRFLSAYNQKVEKQTVAANKGEFKNIAKPTAQKSMKVAGDNSKEKVKGAEKPKPTLQDLSPQFNPLAIKERQQEKQMKQALGGDLDTSEGGDTSQSSDYIKDVDVGVETTLNSREFKYYTYYSRIRRQLSQHWEPRVREKLTRLFRAGRSIASDHDHITKLLIVLNGEGSLVRVQILGESGVHDLDDAAMEAFRSAAPFPNPPKGIIEGDGTVKIRWDFVLES